jgi:hypothetical protein
MGFEYRLDFGRVDATQADQILRSVQGFESFDPELGTYSFRKRSTGDMPDLHAKVDATGIYLCTGPGVMRSMLRILGALLLIAACTRGKGQAPMGRTPAFDAPAPGEVVAPDTHTLAKVRCEVHGGTLITAIVPATIGQPDYDPEYLAASRRLFPNANVSVGLGCFDPDAARVRTKYCDECRRARGAWLADHPSVDSRGYRLDR